MMSLFFYPGCVAEAIFARDSGGGIRPAGKFCKPFVFDRV